MKNRICAIHQPNYFPWVGYFHKIYRADVFIYHDDVPAGYGKKIIWRVRILDNSGQPKWLTVPLEKYEEKAKIRELRINNSLNWTQEHINRLKNYRKCKYFEDYFPLVEDLLKRHSNFTYLVDFNIFLIEEILKILRIAKKTIMRGSEMGVTDSDRTKLIIKMIKASSCNIYLSGQGARNFQGDKDYEDRSIKLIYQDIHNFIEENPYKEDGFVNGLSMLDALFNIGADGIIRLFENYEKWSIDKKRAK